MIVGNNDAAHSAKAETTTIPIVFATGGDPVRDGLVASLNRPGANVTGTVFFAGAVGAKGLELLRQLVPGASIIAMLVNPNTLVTEAERKEVQAAAQAIGQQLVIVDVSSDRDIDAAFATFVQRRLAQCWSAPARSSIPIGSAPSRWQLATRCRPVTASARASWPAA